MVFIKNTSGINVGVGISDITGPAAEIGMVSQKKTVEHHSFELLIINLDRVCQLKPENRGHSYSSVFKSLCL